jgi:MFS family permease
MESQSIGTEGAGAAAGSGWDRRTWAILAILCGALFLDAGDVASVNIALPTIGSHLDMSTSNLQWVVSGYVLGYGGFLLLGGRVADLLGRRQVFLVALTVFGIASAVGGLTDSGTLLIASRFVKGVGAAFTVPAGLSILTTTFTSDEDRHRALGIYSATGAAGFMLGLVIGGLLSEIGWRYVFLVPVPVTAAIVFAGFRELAPTPRPDGGGHYDLPGAFTVTASMLVLVYSIVEAPSHGWTAGRTIGGLVLSAALLVLFVVIERRSPQPLVRLGILRVGSVVSADIAAFFYFGSFLAFQFLTTLCIQDVVGWSPVATALAFVPSSLFLPVLGAQAPRLIGRFGTTKLIAAGLVLFAAGYVLFLNDRSSDLTYVTMLLPTMLVLGLSWGIAFPAMNVQATAGVDSSEQGLAAGLLSTSLQIGAALLIAIVGAVIATHTGNAGGHTDAGILASITTVVWILVGGALLGAVAVFALQRLLPTGASRACGLHLSEAEILATEALAMDKQG